MFRLIAVAIALSLASIGAQAGSFTPLGSFMGPVLGISSMSSARGVSNDGSVVVGLASDVGAGEAFRWTSSTGMVRLSGGSTESGAAGVSADGSVIAGWVWKPSGAEAFRWTSSTGMAGLGTLAGYSGSSAGAVSADGNVIVGTAMGAEELSTYRAFRWTSGIGMVGLGKLAGGMDCSQANDVSGDGSVVVGTASSDTLCEEAFVWTEETGMQRLFDVLVANGASGLEGWKLQFIEGISDDGRYVVGTGVNPFGNQEAFLADISAIPIAPAVWLFGSALGVMGAIRRKVTS